MVSIQNHIVQWKHNRDCLATIKSTFPDWRVTIAFYVALQAVDALLVHDRVRTVTSHATRNATLIHVTRYANIWKHYQPLYGLSRSVRYFASPADWIPADQIEAQVIKRYLYPIEKSVIKLLGQSLSFEPIVFAS